MVVTQGCDIDNKDYITLARIFPLGDLVQEAREALEHNEPLVLHEVARRLTEGHDTSHIAYLGFLDGLGRVVADFLRLQSFPQAWKPCFHKQRWMSLSEDGVKYVQGRLVESAGRFALEQGFWHSTPEDRELADRLTREPDALDKARSQLDAKKASEKGPR